MILAALAFLAYPELVQAQYQYTTNDGKITITGYTGAGGAVIVPGTITDLPVVSIGDAAFRSCSSLTSVTIPSNVTTIGNYAFQWCSSLTSITIPSNVTTIGNYAFLGCSGLASVTIPSGVTIIGAHTFGDCSSLTSVPIPTNVTSIGSSAFQGCSSLTSVTIPARVTTIGTRAFQGCSRLTTITVDTLNPAYRSVDGVLFNSKLTTLVQYPLAKNDSAYAIPATVTSIGSFAFQGCLSLIAVTIPSSVTNIGSSGFSDCTSLSSVSIPSSVTKIADWAFFGCSSLSSAAIPSSVTSIGWASFSGCTSLSSVTIPASVTSIGNAAFQYCSSLTAITVDTLNPAYRSVEGVLFNSNQTRLIQYPSAKSDSTYTIPASVTSVVNYAFQGCSSLTSVTIPASVTTIGSYAFQGCSSLASVTIPSSVTTIESYTFQGCSSLTSVTIPPSVSMIGSYTFQGCASLTSVTIPASVTTIESYTFQGCSGLTSVTIPPGVTIIGDSAFGECISLTGVTIPSSVTSIEYGVFRYCSSLTDVTIPASVTSIGWNAFSGCTSLSSVSIPASVTKIADGAFFGCSSLSSVSIPAGVTKIADGAFFGCSSLSSVSIPAGVVSIESSAFELCRRLARVDIPDGVVSIGSFAFYDCESLDSVTIPASVTNIGSLAFSCCDKIASVTIPASVAGIGAGAFSYCYNLTSITVNANNAFYISTGGILFNKSMTSLVQYPAGRLGSYAIPGGITRIEAHAFAGCTNLTSVSIPASVTTIGEGRPFSACSRLTSITVKAANAVFSGVDGVLYNKAKTTLIRYPQGKTGGCIIPSSVIRIETGAFYEANKLASVTIPAAVTNIGEVAFAGCDGLASITVSAANAAYCSVGGVLFDKTRTTLIQYPDNKPGNYTIPASVTRIGRWAFNGCSKLASVSIPSSVTNIVEEHTFGGSCSNLTAITVDAANAFYSSVDGVLFNKQKTTLICHPGGKAGNYTIPSGVTHIGPRAFYFGKGLTGVIIPPSVTNIGWSAFSWCPKLTAVCFQGNAPSLEINWLNSLFDDDSQATIYYVPGTTGWTNPWGNRPTVSGSPPGQLCFAASAYSAQEGALCTVKVKRVFGSSGTVSVTCVTKSVTATGPQDYTAKTNTLTWTNGQTAAQSFVIPIRADGKPEGAETFQVVLKNPVGATLAAPLKTTVTILANTKGVSSGATVAATQRDKLAEALDGEGLVWLTSSRLPWTKQLFVTVDGEDAAISGEAALDRVSWLQADVEGPGSLTYDWLVKGFGLDTCLLLVDGKVMRTRIPGHDWAHEALPIDEGSHTIRWVFVGDTGLTPGAAYLDQVTWTPGGE